MSNSGTETPIIVIGGPTAVGKTAVAVALAQAVNGEVISADSMQVYRHLQVGTAKPTCDELQGVPYHLIDMVEPSYQYNLGDYVLDAERVLAEIRSRGRVPIICGGTGMYIKGLVVGVFEELSRDRYVREKLEMRADAEGLTSLHAEMLRADPAASYIKPNDRKRLLRALEVFEVTGRPFTSFHQHTADNPRHRSEMFVLMLPRPVLYHRINERVDAMMQAGMLEELERYVRAGYSVENPCIRALGYADLLQYLNGSCSLQDATNRMKQKTRNYAKRQMTWFRHTPGARFLDVSEHSEISAALWIKKTLAI